MTVRHPFCAAVSVDYGVAEPVGEGVCVVGGSGGVAGCKEEREMTWMERRG